MSAWDLWEVEDVVRERRRQDMYRNMIPHQEVAKLVAYAHFRGELPTVGPIMIKRPDFRAQNERARKAADDEDRWLATLRKRAHAPTGLHGSRSETSLRDRSAGDRIGGGAAPAHSSTASSSCSAASSSAPARGTHGIGGGASAARERVRTRAQRASALANAVRNVPDAPAIHFRRLHPFSANHQLPFSPRQRQQHTQQHSHTLQLQLQEQEQEEEEQRRQRQPQLGSSSLPGSPSHDGGVGSRFGVGPSRQPSAFESDSSGLRPELQQQQSSLLHAHSESALLRAVSSVSLGPTCATHASARALDSTPTPVSFWTAVPPAPLDRSEEWKLSGSFWAVGDGGPPPPMDALLLAEASTRRRTDGMVRFARTGSSRFPRPPRPAVGPQIGPGAYSRLYGERSQDPWDLPTNQRLRPSPAFAAREIDRSDFGLPGARDLEPDTVGLVGPGGLLVGPVPPLAAEFAQYTFSAAAHLHAAERARAAHANSTGGTGGLANAHISIAQRQRVGREKLRTKLELGDEQRKLDPANDSISARPSSAYQRRMQVATLARLGGTSLPLGTKIFPAGLTVVANKVLSTRVAPS